MPNISETVRETFIKLSGFFWGSSLRYSVQNMEGICPPNFGGRSGKVETLTAYSSKMRGPEDLIFCAVGGL